MNVFRFASKFTQGLSGFRLTKSGPANSPPKVTCESAGYEDTVGNGAVLAEVLL
jgi:hypothetical protein